MSCVALINIIIDPGEIYLKKIIGDIKSKEFSDKLYHSENGVIQTGWNERLIKTALAKTAGDFDCIILGSSHMLQISSVRNTGGIRDKCHNLLNLSVSGGGLEDIAIFSYLVLNNPNLPKRVFIGIDPWTIKFGMDSRYGAYKSYYEKMNVLLSQQGAGENISYFKKAVQNLFNGEYFYYSILSLSDNDKEEFSLLFQKAILYPDKNFSYEDGYAEPVTLKDGSHVYSQAWILAQKNKSIAIGGGAYKISGAKYDPVALEYFRRLIKLYQSLNVNVNLIMTPYHPNVFKSGQTKPVKYFKVIDETVKKLSQQNNVEYYGSFFPNKLGCKDSEFFDFMHATNKCLNRIDFRL